MKAYVRRYVAIAAISLLTGCETHGNIDDVAGPPKANEAYFVIGLQPEFTRMAITDGTISNGHFNISLAVRMWGINVPYEGIVQDGYFVGKVPANTPLAIQILQLFRSKTALLGPVYHACAGEGETFGKQKWFVFQLAPGQVAYIADLQLRGAPHDTISAAITQNFGAAQTFVKAHYPAFNLEQGSYQVLAC